MDTRRTNMTKQPSYRFAGYTEPWEQRKLGECTEISAGGDIEKSKLLNNGKYPVIANALTNDGIVGYYNDSYRIEAPAVTVTGRGDVGVAKARNVNFTPVVRLLSLKSEHDVIFLENAINTQKIVIESTGVPQLTAPQLGRYNIFFPSLPEQTAIGSFFQDIDQLISLQQRKLEVLKEQKKTYLKLLFPAKGQTKPALRFAGFEDDWKEVKLGDFVEISKGIQRNKEFLSPNADNKNCYPVYNGGKQESGYTDEFNREGNIMISEGGASAGFVNYFDGKYWSGGHNFTIDELENNIHYVLALLESQQQELYSLQVGSGLPNIQLNSLKKVIIAFPDFQEQEAIGSFFQDLDKAIAKQEEKVKNLKESKQTLLRKMFI